MVTTKYRFFEEIHIFLRGVWSRFLLDCEKYGFVSRLLQKLFCLSMYIYSSRNYPNLWRSTRYNHILKLLVVLNHIPANPNFSIDVNNTRLFDSYVKRRAFEYGNAPIINILQNFMESFCNTCANGTRAHENITFNTHRIKRGKE